MTTLEMRLQAMSAELAQGEPVMVHDDKVVTAGDLLSDDSLPGLWNILNWGCA
ncbi:hypothetical protein ACIA8O_10685 [Kitasatospora sp. NPDC051853]|uniref:hypothetical protein n=1 Tax=Kitasatospora sp. NPDC051853 TaxID=3364058 RepID=UPI0037B0EF72